MAKLGEATIDMVGGPLVMNDGLMSLVAEEGILSTVSVL